MSCRGTASRWGSQTTRRATPRGSCARAGCLPSSIWRTRTRARRSLMVRCSLWSRRGRSAPSRACWTWVSCALRPATASSARSRAQLTAASTSRTLRSVSRATTGKARSTMLRRTKSTFLAATFRSTWSCLRRRIRSATRRSSPSTLRKNSRATVSRIFTRRRTKRFVRTRSTSRPRRKIRTNPSTPSPSAPTRSARLPSGPRRLQSWRMLTMTTTTTTLTTTMRSRRQTWRARQWQTGAQRGAGCRLGPSRGILANFTAMVAWTCLDRVFSTRALYVGVPRPISSTPPLRQTMPRLRMRAVEVLGHG
mmetsp:Transcript_85950/g.171626  ORF Transcript_85950/g.171626 Transcript_85950/m.171626 type:complete len:308 (+) Transcript_85950:260-1183(+)